MKKIIFSFCIAVVASLSATYVNASKSNTSYYYYARTFDETYVKLYGYYEGENCINFNGQSDKCGYYVTPVSYPNKYPGKYPGDSSGILPDTLYSFEITIWTSQGYLNPFSIGRGVYMTD